MKTHMNHLVLPIFVATTLVLAPGCATEKSQRELKAKAKISESQARQIALAKAPGGKVKEFEIEEEGGKLVWSFDIATPGTQDITEVLVDALTGDVVSVDKETPAQQEKEKKETK